MTEQRPALVHGEGGSLQRCVYAEVAEKSANGKRAHWARRDERRLASRVRGDVVTRERTPGGPPSAELCAPSN